MKVIKPRAAAVVGLVLVGLVIGGWLLVFTADGPVEKQTINNPIETEGKAVEEQTEDNPIAEADNSFCYVCHLNYQAEELVLSHERAGVGCEMCHGESDRHSSDEDGITPPDTMYSKEKINPSCMACHPEDKIIEQETHEPLLSGAAAVYCTDCHGEHRLEVRTRRWDKETGKLISDDGVRVEDKALEVGR